MKRVLCLLPVAVSLLTGFAHAATPIPEGPDADEAPAFIGAPATQNPVFTRQPPRHPFMAPNERSNLHVDAFQTDTNVLPGPLGNDLRRVSTFFSRDCASVTFDSRGRIVTVCVGLDGPRLFALDAQTLDTLAEFALPPRQPGVATNLFQDFAGGGYFYLDHEDRAIVPTTTRHLWVVAAGDSFTLERDYDLTSAVPPGDKIISALPDWNGLIWFASTEGVIGTLDLASGEVRSLDTREKNGNSFAVDDTGAVYIVTDPALYKLRAGPDGTPQVEWRATYPNIGTVKPGQTQAGSGTTPTIMTAGPWVAITDNADPMNVLVLNRADGSEVCSVPVFERGASNTDQSLIAAGRAIVTENNYGYTGPAATENGRTTTPGLERVDVDRDGSGCTKVWRSEEIAPSVVPKMSLANGLVYTYTKPAGEGSDPWYLTAIDFRTGRTVYKARMGAGLGFNNNYAPVTLGPDGTAYVGVLGGLAALRDGTPPPRVAQNRRPRLALRLRYSRTRLCTARRRARATIGGPDRALVSAATFRYRAERRRDSQAPFRARFRVGPGRLARGVRARVTLEDGRAITLRRAVRPCARAAPGFVG